MKREKGRHGLHDTDGLVELELQGLQGGFKWECVLGYPTLGCPKMHQLLKSHAPQAKSNGNHPTELAKSNKSPMG